MRAIRVAAGAMVVAAILLALALAAVAALRGHPQDLPWTRVDLGDPIGVFTGRKIAALREDFGQCRAVLDRAGVRYTALPPLRPAEATCGYGDAVRFAAGGSRRVAFSPANLGTSCAVAAGLAAWEWHVVQPAAQRLFNSRVVSIEHFGSYNCRRIGSGEGGNWSEHARANAVDIAGFRLADGTRITVAADWKGDGPKATFLHEVRNGACRLFATTLSPEYNAAHHDHLHLDQAARGEWGWRACR